MPAAAGVVGAELEVLWKDIERVAVGGPLVVFGSSAGEAATATLTSVSKAALLPFPCCGREAIMDFNEGAPLPTLLAGPEGSLVRVYEAGGRMGRGLFDLLDME